MAAFYNSVVPPGLLRSVRCRVSTALAARLLRRHGAEVARDFTSDGLPQVHLADLRRDRVSLADFRGRIVLRAGCSMNTAGVSPFPTGPVRLTIARWGPGPDDCGLIDVASALNGTAIVSYVRVTIGRGVTFGPSVTIMDCDGHSMDRSQPDTIENMAPAPIVIEDGAWIGYGATILKGVRVGARAVVAAHALVVRDVPAGAIVGGVPARELRAAHDVPSLLARRAEALVSGG
jgi:acetyltransferase-like isoleucine patch superfamily enzyme